MKHLFAVFLAVVVLGSGCTTNQSPPVNPPNTPAVQQIPTSGVDLDLSNKGLTSIPSDVFSRTDLEKLNLSKNRLTGAPQSQIGQLKSLKSLDLSNNALTGLPAELGQLTKLETLNVSNNKLTGLPMELGNLTQLRVLDVSGNDYSTQDLDQIAAKLTKTQIRR
jgi:Leucine-rich repeat (LRR) protein